MKADMPMAMAARRVRIHRNPSTSLRASELSSTVILYPRR